MNGLAKKKGITDKDVDSKELAMGLEVEKEHTDDPAVAKQVALDHLTEIPDYYTRLKAMEDKAKMKEKKANSEEAAESQPQAAAGAVDIEAKVKQIIAENPGLNDDKFHELAEAAGLDVHKAEEVAYQMAHKYTQMQSGSANAEPAAVAEAPVTAPSVKVADSRVASLAYDFLFKIAEAWAADEPVKKVPEETEDRQEKSLGAQKGKDGPLPAETAALTPKATEKLPSLEQERKLDNTQSSAAAKDMSEGVGKQTDDLTMNREQDKAPEQDKLIDPERQSEEQKEARVMNYTDKMAAAEAHVVDCIMKAAADDMPCPGSKIRSKGMGRGLGLGKGKGPMGVPVKAKAMAEKVKGPEETVASAMGKLKGQPGKQKKVLSDLRKESGMPLSEKKTFKGGKSEPASKAKPGEGGRFKALVKKLASATMTDVQFVDTLIKLSEVRDPKALAAAIGRKKYGKEKFQQMAATGRQKKAATAAVATPLTEDSSKRKRARRKLLARLMAAGKGGLVGGGMLGGSAMLLGKKKDILPASAAGAALGSLLGLSGNELRMALREWQGLDPTQSTQIVRV